VAFVVFFAQYRLDLLTAVRRIERREYGGFLTDAVERMIRQGQRNRMFLANRAIQK
jgi:hypothetical protein